MTPKQRNDAADARRWRALLELAGRLGDGSAVTVTLSQDDETRTGLIKAGRSEYYIEGKGFDAAIDKACLQNGIES